MITPASALAVLSSTAIVASEASGAGPAARFSTRSRSNSMGTSSQKPVKGWGEAAASASARRAGFRKTASSTTECPVASACRARANISA